MARVIFFAAPLGAVLAPMTGMAFLLFSFYMISDPSTTPGTPKQQVVFGAAVGVAYGFLLTAHVAFTLFFSLALVCSLRGTYHYVLILRKLIATAFSQSRRSAIDTATELPVAAATTSVARHG